MKAASPLQQVARRIRSVRPPVPTAGSSASAARAALSVTRHTPAADALVRSVRSRADGPVLDGAGDLLRKLSPSDFTRLVQLSDPTRIAHVTQLQHRLEAIADTFARSGDTRGLFASVYAPTTARVLEARSSGRIRDVALSDALSLDFGKRYLENLHAHLQGKPVSVAWARYYEQALASDRPSFRVLATGMNAHLTVDLPASLAAVKVPPSFKRDFLQVGRAMADGTPALVARVRSDHGLDLSRLFEGYAPGRALSRIFGPNAPSRAVFQGIRNEAWCQGHLLQQGASSEAFARRQIVFSFRLRQGLLDMVPI